MLMQRLVRMTRQAAALKYATGGLHNSRNSLLTYKENWRIVNTSPGRSPQFTGPWSVLVQQHRDMATASVAKEEPESETPASNQGQESKETTKEHSAYWGLVPKPQFREDGTPWRWSCFNVCALIRLPWYPTTLTPVSVSNTSHILACIIP